MEIHLQYPEIKGKLKKDLGLWVVADCRNLPLREAVLLFLGFGNNNI